MSLRERLFLLRLRDREEEAFAEMVLAHQDRVFGLLYRMLGSREEAEDVAQEVFLTVFRSIDQFRGDAQLSTWIYRIAANQCKNRLSRLARERPGFRADVAADGGKGDESGGDEPGVGHAWDTGAGANRPDVRLEEQQRDALVQKAISELDEEHRLLVILRDVQGLAYQEIVEITGLEEGTVKSRLHRGRMRLKEVIAAAMDADRDGGKAEAKTRAKAKDGSERT